MKGIDVKNSGSRVFVYDCINKRFGDGKASQKPVIAENDLPVFNSIINEISKSDSPSAYYAELCAENQSGLFVNHSAGFVSSDPKESIIVTLTESDKLHSNSNNFDSLTGLLTRKAFSDFIEKIECQTSLEPDEKAFVAYFDVQRFKLVNDMFGVAEGDRLLNHIADILNDAVGEFGAACRINSDRFVFIAKCRSDEFDSFIEKILEDISEFDLPFEILCNAGVYVLDSKRLSADLIIDRAIIAQSPVKGSYTKRYNYFTEVLREDLLTEQEITGLMKSALKNEQFVIYFQPQYNNSTGMIVGTEALVRWNHPDKGIVPPGTFISVFEKNGFITKLDLYVFEKVCKFLRECIDNNLPVVPVSTNLTRYDIFSPNFIEKLEETRRKYDVPPKYIRVEITESAALGNSQFINEAVKKLHSFGYIVEMDDFGSGYSSLSILKDIDFDIIKLDMKFLESEKEGRNRGGTILSSVVRMVNWLNLPVIAEGVETIEQADYLRSIGCEYIQGFLYSKPLPEDEYRALISKTAVGATIPQMKLIDKLNASNFWSNDSLETLIFNNFVGGSAIFDYRDGNSEILRVNRKYLYELGMNLSEKEIVNTNPFDFFDEANKSIYIKTLELAIETGDEQECETWRTITSPCCGKEKMCIRSTVRMIGKSKENYLFYATIRNITAEKNKYAAILDNEKRFKMASEQVNIYYWEYTVATHEMRPCFRCMRDLGLPALLTNYPDSAIEMGVFPPETADMYRDWHRQIAEGVPELEAVIPLTVGRIPFRVRYTTEFDENGRPIKAYGSAALVVN